MISGGCAEVDPPGTERTRFVRVRRDSISDGAARWLVALKNGDEAVKAGFVSWVRRSPRHFGAFLRASAEEFECVEDSGSAGCADLSLVEAVAERGELQNQLYLRYRRPLLQAFQRRRIDRDAAEDLLQRTFLQAVKKIRKEGLEDPANLGGYLYRTACKLAGAYWRGEFSRRREDSSEVLTSMEDEALSIEEHVTHEQLARYVRDLMDHLPPRPDREVLERLYLSEEPLVAIRESLQLTDLQFDQVLWSARQRFGEILRRNGVSMAAV